MFQIAKFALFQIFILNRWSDDEVTITACKHDLMWTIEQQTKTT